MARAQGARAQMALAFESTYGTPPAGGFVKMPFASTTLGAEQPLLNSELLGYGRDPLAPIKDAVTADGDVVVPLDAEAFGFWLQAAFGDPTTTGTGPWTHAFQSGSWTLPSLSIETGMPEVPRFCVDALNEAIARYGPPEIMNTDQGSQFTGSAWITTLTEAGVRISMDGRGRYLDNIFIERLWRSLKQEAIYLEEITNGFQARRVVKNWMAFYNTRRPHSALDRQTPDDAYWAGLKSDTQHET